MPRGKSWQQIAVKHGISRGRACHKFRPYREEMRRLMKLWKTNFYNTRQRIRSLHAMTETDPETAEAIVSQD